MMISIKQMKITLSELQSIADALKVQCDLLDEAYMRYKSIGMGHETKKMIVELQNEVLSDYQSMKGLILALCEIISCYEHAEQTLTYEAFGEGKIVKSQELLLDNLQVMMKELNLNFKNI